MKMTHRSAPTALLVTAAILALLGSVAWARLAAIAAQPTGGAAPSRIVEGTFDSDRLPRSMNYAVLLPEGYDESQERYPVLFQLYPGPPESHRAIQRWKPHVELAWDEGRLPEALVVTPAIDISMYRDAQGDGRVWEEVFVGPFLDHLRREFRVREDRPAFYAMGLSAGGAITLRLGLKYPETFGGIAALAPGIEAAFALDELTFEDTFWRPPNQYDGVDPGAWESYNPLNIAIGNADRIRATEMGIYLETGDEDSFMLDRGTELMHRTLRDNGIRHEYHLRLGVDHHVGTVMPTRWQEAYGFLGARMRNLPQEAIVTDLQETVGAVKEEAAKGIPNNPRINQLRVPVFGFSRRQLELETEWLRERGYSR